MSASTMDWPDLPRTPSLRLDGRRALVTGASRGIGLAAAAALAEAGAHVTLIARNAAPLQGVVDAIRARNYEAESLVLDLLNPERVEKTLAELKPFDILVNNAGVSRPRKFLDTTHEDFDWVVDTNLRAAYFVARAVARGMVSAGRGGSIIHISSQMGHVGGIDRTVYSATKHALEGLTKSMAIELAPHGIRVNTICPTFVETALAQTTLADPERKAWIMSSIKLGRLARLEDLMGPIVLLAGDASSMMTGSAVLVDGGWTAA